MSNFILGIVTGVCATVCGALLIDGALAAAAMRRKLRDKRRPRLW